MSDATKKNMKRLVEEINNIFDVLPTQMNPDQKNLFRKVVMGPAIQEIEDNIINSRPPKMMFVGRSGHGKSSTINALAGKKVVDVSDVGSCQGQSIPLYVEFDEFSTAWQFIDTRGYFDSVKPEDATMENAEEQLFTDIMHYKPDIFMHVINIKEVRALSNDIEAFRSIRKKITKKGLNIPAIVVLTHCDILGKRAEWPINEHPQKAAQVIEGMNLLGKEILGLEKLENIDSDSPIKGCLTEDDTYLGIIPTCSSEDELWNIDTLRKFIGKSLPKDARFDFFRVAKDKELLRDLSGSIIKRFSVITGCVGTLPFPMADIIPLTMLQMLLISIIALISGREISKDNLEPLYEYAAAVGINIGAAVGLKQLARQMVKLIPVGGLVISGSIAASATYAIGKSAEMYYFTNKVVKPSDIKGNVQTSGVVD